MSGAVGGCPKPAHLFLPLPIFLFSPGFVFVCAAVCVWVLVLVRATYWAPKFSFSKQCGDILTSLPNFWVFRLSSAVICWYLFVLWINVQQQHHLKITPKYWPAELQPGWLFNFQNWVIADGWMPPLTAQSGSTAAQWQVVSKFRSKTLLNC